MKQLKKILVFILSVALAVGAFFTGPFKKVSADTPVPTGDARLGASIELSKLPTTGNVGSTFNLPKGATNDGDIVMVVKDSRGNVIYNNEDANNVVIGAGVTDDAEHNMVVVAPNRIGTYTVQYKVINTTTFAEAKSQVYRIEVDGVRPTLAFEENTQFIMPTEIGGTDQIVLPFPTVTNSEGEEVETNNDSDRLEITATSPRHTAVVLTETTIGENEVHKVFAPVKDNDENIVYGTYYITYSYTDTNGLVVTKSYAVKVSEYLDYNNQDLALTFANSVPTSLVLGNEVTLPTPTVVDKNNGSSTVDSYTKITVRYFNVNDNEGELVQTDGLTFTPMKKASGGAYYLVKYDVRTFSTLNDDAKALTAEYIIKNVIDSEVPTVYVVDDYDEQTDMTNPRNVDYKIPTKIVLGETYYIPAIYATDNYKDDENVLKLVRNITTPDNKQVIIKNSVTEAEGNSTNPLYQENIDNQAVAYTFTQVGTYYITYQATDVANPNKPAELSFKVVVVDGNVDTFDTTAPVITMPTIAGNAEIGETVSFKAPTAKDLVTGTKDVVDDKVEINVYYATAYDIVDNEIEVSNENKTKIEANEEGSYEFVVPTTDANSLAVIVEAVDDHGNKTVEFRTIDLINVEADTVAPHLESALPTDSDSNEQGERVYVPTLVFADENYKYVNISVWVYDAKGNDVEVLGKSLEYKEDTQTIEVKNINFLANNKGVYTVVITASDASGNTTVVSYMHYVPDTQAPTLELDEIPTVAEVGVAVDLPKPVIKDDNVIVNYTAKVVFVGDNNPSDYTLNGYKFTPRAAGTYTFKYVTTDGNNEAESAIYTITAKDTIKPVITLDESIVFPISAELEEVNTGAVPTYNSIVIPGFDATDANNGIKEVSVTVTAPGENKLTVTQTAEGHYEFTPTKEGEYVVVYKAVDKAGNSESITKRIKVGDCIDPKIVVTGSQNLPTSVKTDTQIVIDTSKITMTDNKDTDMTIADNLTITLTGPDGKTVENVAEEVNKFIFDIANAGTYKLVYTATDNAGNSTSKVVTFEATVEAGSTIFTQETTSVILIIVGVAILAGVVIYFVSTRDKKELVK